MRDIAGCFVLLILCCFLRRMDSLESNYDVNGLSLGNSEWALSTGSREDGEEFEKRIKVNYELKNFYEKDDTICKAEVAKYKKLNEMIDNYIQRYVSLVLITSNLVDREVKDSNEIIKADFEIVVTGEELSYLQQFSKREKSHPVERDLSKLNSILSKIAQIKQRTLAEKAAQLAKSYFFGFDFSYGISDNFYLLLNFFVVLAITVAIYEVFSKRNFYLVLVIGLNSLILTESLITYWKRLKETDIEIYVKTLQFREIPKDCDPTTTTSWYHSLSNLIFGDNCLQYYKTLDRKSIEEVSLVECILEKYAAYFVQIPSKVFGASVRSLTGEISGFWPSPFNHLFYLVLVPVVLLLTCFVILVLSGSRVKLSWFGSGIQVDRPKTLPERESLDFHERKALSSRKKLRPWTMSKRSRLDLREGRRKKLMLKPSRSVGDSIEVSPESYDEKED